MILVIAVMISALTVVYEKHRSRQLFTELRNLEKRLDNYEVEWGKLQLEQTTLAGHGWVEGKARDKLDLVLPGKESVVYITR